MQFSDSFFATRCGITRQDLESYLADALSQGGDYADLYFEYLATSSISIDESMVKSAAQGVSHPILASARPKPLNMSRMQTMKSSSPFRSKCWAARASYRRMAAGT